MAPIQKSRFWTFTLYPRDVILLDDGTLSSEDATTFVGEKAAGGASYCCLGIELCPETRRPHYQGYCEFSSRVSRRYVGLLLGYSPHLERRRGNQEEAITYCKKDGRFFESGARSISRRGKRSDLESIQ